ncbi:MAG: hypothetical protein M3Z16_08050 [Pseudomonadota bacterium]|nr:hypothetical protein [Pseudomonadota bacterium]
MTLSSKLFKNDRQLQACEVNDQAHLTQGTSGEHVAKVQMALFAIDRSVIDRAELSAQRYGSSTAQAVLAFKSRRQIINTAYQSKADDIVGKMTIARLDQEMFLIETINRPPGECVSATTGASPIVSSLGSSTAFGLASSKGLVGDTSPPKPRLNRALRIYCSITRRAALETGFPIAAQVDTARELLAGFGLTLSVEFGPVSGTTFADTINFPFGQVGAEEIPLLRKASEDTRAGFPKILRVIVCPRPLAQGPGETFRNVTVGGTRFPPFVVLNSTTPSRDNSTLLHEMIHASLPGPENHDGDKFSVFFEFSPTRPDSPDRVVLPTDRAISLSKAFFVA